MFTPPLEYKENSVTQLGENHFTQAFHFLIKYSIVPCWVSTIIYCFFEISMKYVIDFAYRIYLFVIDHLREQQTLKSRHCRQILSTSWFLLFGIFVKVSTYLHGQLHKTLTPTFLQKFNK